jgi:hypothetical protein
MRELPKPRRLDLRNARRYIKEACGLDSYLEVDPTFFDALCNDEIYFAGDLSTPRRGSDVLIERNHRVAPLFWRHWGFHAFDAGTLANDVVCLPDQRSEYNRIFYTNLTIETAQIDSWLSKSESPKVRVSVVPEKEYKQRIEEAIAMSIIYSRGEDREWAKANGYSVESVQQMRKTHAPKEWQDAGRRSSKNLQKE